jgi:glycogen debranching enzyme
MDRRVGSELAKYLEWLMANRDTDGNGLLEWAVEIHANCRSGESGMDNSPHFDGAIQLDAPDFNAYFASECEILAEFLPAEKEYWMAHHDRICKLMNERLWSPEQGLYVDYDVAGNCRTDILASAGFLPLLCGAPSQEQAEKMAAHLTNPETFGTPLRIPSIAANNKEAANAALSVAISTIESACSKGVYHKNNAARKVSRITKLVNTLA